MPCGILKVYDFKFILSIYKLYPITFSSNPNARTKTTTPTLVTTTATVFNIYNRKSGVCMLCNALWDIKLSDFKFWWTRKNNATFGFIAPLQWLMGVFSTNPLCSLCQGFFFAQDSTIVMQISWNLESVINF